jgi:NitT/TauT family transport system substrate-binding protein
MRVMRRTWLAALTVSVALVGAACGSEDEEAASSAVAEAVESATAPAAEGETGETGAATSTPERAEVTLQLKWVTQAQFAGYYAADAQGYYDDEGLDVELKVGGPDITPEQVVASGQAEFGIDWLPALLAARDQGGDLVNIAQVFARSGMTEVTHKDSGITDVAGLRGKKVGVWCCGNENELLAALVKNGMDPKKDVQIVNQPFDMSLFLNRTVDAAAAMTYNELAQVLETKNPKTGKLYTLDDLNVITMEDAGTAMLEDGIFVQGEWISDPKNQDIATRFLKASLKGWVYCRDNPDDCVKTVLDNGPTLGEGPPAVDDERDQRADLACGRGRHRRHGPGGVRPHGRDRPAVQGHLQGARGRLRHRLRRGGRRGPQGGGRRRGRVELHEAHRRGHRGRPVAARARRVGPWVDPDRAPCASDADQAA